MAFLLLAACSSGSSSSPAAPTTSAGPFDGLAAPPEAMHAELPPIRSIESVGGTTMSATHGIDWTLVSGETAWMTGLGGGIGRFDASTGKQLGSLEMFEGPCGALGAGFHAVWTLTCREPGVAKVSASGATYDWVSVPGLAVNEGETSVGVGEGGVWAISDAGACYACSVVKIDPDAMKVVASYPIPQFATGVRAGEGGVWVVYADFDAVVHLDPESGQVVATIAVGQGPRFFDVGAGGVWVMNQDDGSVSHIDPETDIVAATIAVDASIDGGDLTVGDGKVWVRATDELVAEIDPSTDAVVARIGEPEGSGSASADAGELWISAHDVAKLYRVPTSGL
jgi:YVTN family beta-propeller protein